MKFAILCFSVLLYVLSVGTTLGQETTAIPDSLKPLHQSGWAYEIKGPIGDHTPDEGKIVYRLTVNREGELVSLDLIESTVSEETELLYRKATSKITFRRVGDAVPAERSSGIITYVLRNRDDQVAPVGKKQEPRQRKMKAIKNN